MDPFTETLNRQIGKRLRDARVMRGLSLKQLGKIVGVTSQQVQKYEDGVNGLSPAKMKLFADSLGVTINWLFGATEMEMPHIKASRQRLLRLWQGLHRLEQQHPATFDLLCSYVIGLAEAQKK